MSRRLSLPRPQKTLQPRPPRPYSRGFLWARKSLGSTRARIRVMFFRRNEDQGAAGDIDVSRLDSFIRRLEAQRACLTLAAEAIGDEKGTVLELGLGNGRTYDHLRECLPKRDIFVFEREVRAHPDCIPDEEHLILGLIEETLPAFAQDRPGEAILAHSDIGTGDAKRNRKLAAWLAKALPALLRPGAWLAADQALPEQAFVQQPLPPGIATDRYFLYRYLPA